MDPIMNQPAPVRWRERDIAALKACDQLGY
jgi:hypothetical protein